MSDKKKSNRKFRSLKMESLEKRELMAADAFIANGVLNIRGTDAADNISVESSYGTTRVWANGKRILQEATISYSSVDARMNGGNDNLRIILREHIGLNRVDVNMGRGSSENLTIQVGRANVVDVNADLSVATDVFLQRSSVGTVKVNFGNDGGNDGLSVNSSDIGTLSSNMGGGRDFFGVSSTSIGQAAVNLGSGDDEFRIDTKNSQIRSGFVDGGPGRDRFRNFGGNSPGRVVVRNFEW
jgi:hypothetical protein